MEEFASLLHRDYGLKPQGKMAPMSNFNQRPFSTSAAKPSRVGNPKNGKDYGSSPPVSVTDDDPRFGGTGITSSSTRSAASGEYDPLKSRHDDAVGGSTAAPSSTLIFEDILAPAASNSIPSVREPSAHPVLNAPVYDDDIFGGMPGIRSANSAFDDVFNIGSLAAASSTTVPASSDDLLSGFRTSNTKKMNSNESITAVDSALDDLLPGFGTADSIKPMLSEAGKSSQHNNPEIFNAFSSNIQENPSVVLNPDYKTPADYSTGSSEWHSESKSADSDKLSNCFDGKQSSANSVDGENNASYQGSDWSTPAESLMPKNGESDNSPTPSGAAGESRGSNHMAHAAGVVEDHVMAREHKPNISRIVEDDSSMHMSSSKSTSAASPSRRNRATQIGEANPSFKQSKMSFQGPASSASRDKEEAPSRASKIGETGKMDEFWLSIDDVKLVTQPSTAPPPVRPPPEPGSRQGRVQRKLSLKGISVENGAHFFPGRTVKGGTDSDDTTWDIFGAFVPGSPGKMDADVRDTGLAASSLGNEEWGSSAATGSGAAMREAIENAEAKIHQAKEAKENNRNRTQGPRKKEDGLAHVRVEQAEARSLHDKERDHRQKSEREARDNHRSEKVNEEREREEERQRGREGELNQTNRANEINLQWAAIEIAKAEVREREAHRAAERATEARRKAERAAVERATEEARERHERAAAEKARAEKIAMSEREKVEKNKMNASREQQTNTEDDLDSFFKSTFRPTSAPKQRSGATDAIPPNQGLWTSKNSYSAFKKVQSVPSITEDLTSLFGSDTFQEVEGEKAERRKARWDRYQRTRERTAKALEEKHQRDLQIMKDQEERQRAGELVDAEIKRWAAGKEGNLRALLSTLQYVLWPECGWQPVSLTDLITASAVKKVYKTATLCVHPDKMQQKGATNQQKYVAEKVFYLLKEASNKFGREELF